MAEDGDGMLSGIDGHALQRNLTCLADRNPIHLSHIQRVQLASPCGTVVSSAAVVFGLDGDGGVSRGQKGGFQVVQGDV